MNKINKLIITAIALLIFSILLDGFSTYLLFQKDYDRMMKYEVNLEAKENVLKYGIFWGSIMVGNEGLIGYLAVAVTGAWIIAIFFFNDFKEGYSYGDRLIICSCLGVILVAGFKIGAGLLNLMNWILV